jgi:hypothetical protein
MRGVAQTRAVFFLFYNLYLDDTVCLCTHPCHTSFTQMNLNGSINSGTRVDSVVNGGLRGVSVGAVLMKMRLTQRTERCRSLA